MRRPKFGQTIGSRAIGPTPRLQWGLLAGAYGSDEALRAAIDHLASTAPELLEGDVLALALRYRGGWRPDDFGND